MGLALNADGSAVWHCFRCDFAGARDANREMAQRIGNSSVRRTEHKQFDMLAPSWSSYWERLGALRDEGVAYLQARGCAIPPTDGDLRFDPHGRHPSGYVGPCLVALVSDFQTTQPISLHRTWVCADGRKPNIAMPRLLLGGHRKRGGAIFLWPSEAVEMALGVGEGVETTLTLARYFRPVWSLIDAGNLQRFDVLPGIRSITICADNDPSGLKASNACAERWAASGREARVVCAPERGADLNDFLREARHG